MKNKAQRFVKDLTNKVIAQHLEYSTTTAQDPTNLITD